jgi:hypothetical protein
LNKRKEEAKKKEWTGPELTYLAKLMIKYPGALKNRWQQISDSLGDRFSIKDIIAKAKSLEA